MNEEVFTSLVAIQMPAGTTMTIMDGIVYEADVYGVIRVTQGVADKLLKDCRFKALDVKSRKVADPTESKTQDAITKQVAEDSAKAEVKQAQAGAATQGNNPFNKR